MRWMRFIWIFVLLWAGSLRAQSPVPCRRPLSEEQLVDLIRSHVPEARLELFVRTCGISFQVDGAAAARLRAGRSARRDPFAATEDPAQEGPCD